MRGAAPARTYAEQDTKAELEKLTAKGISNLSAFELRRMGDLTEALEKSKAKAKENAKSGEKKKAEIKKQLRVRLLRPNGESLSKTADYFSEKIDIEAPIEVAVADIVQQFGCVKPLLPLRIDFLVHAGMKI